MTHETNLARNRYVGMVIVGIAAVLLLIWLVPFSRGLSFVIRAANLQGVTRRLANYVSVLEGERVITIALPSGSIRARVYAPNGASRQTVLLVSGLHPAGIEEPRLVALARELARSGLVVLTPDIPALRRFEITPQLTDRIEETAEWLADTHDLAPAGRIGLMGISFSGGLSIVAAGRAHLRDRLLYVFSLGGHDDLPRVLQYLSTGVISGLPAGAAAPGPPHDYGVAVVLLNVAEDLVPREQVGPLREAVQRFLAASSLESIDRLAAAHEFAALRELAEQLPAPSAMLLKAINNRDVAHLGPLLAPHIASHVESAALSPSKSAPPRAPVFLLHGKDDTIIPARESTDLAARLDGRVPVRVLITDLISHAERDRPARIGDVVRLATFWADLLDR